jgi:hypothetical protein
MKNPNPDVGQIAPFHQSKSTSRFQPDRLTFPPPARIPTKKAARLIIPSENPLTLEHLSRTA